MSTRRSTRAVSRGTSPASAAPSAVSAATPRRSGRRPGSAVTSAADILPATGVKTSTAYGTNDVAQPGRDGGPQVSAQISNVLQTLLEPIQENDATSNASNRGGRGNRGAHSQASSAHGSRVASTESPSMVADKSASFTHESGVFGVAGLESSMGSPGDLSDILEEHESTSSSHSSPRINDQNEEARRLALEMIARHERIERVPVATQLIGKLRTYNYWFSERVQVNGGRMSFWLRCLVGLTCALIAVFFFITWLPNNNYHNYGLGALSHNIGQFMPSGRIWSSGDVDNLRTRITNAEREIIKLKQRSDLDKETVSKLKNILPEFIVGSKDKLGNFILPNGLWHAIQDKIRSDHTLVFENADRGKKGEKNAVVTANDIDRMVGKSWENFLKQNEIKSKAVTGDGIDRRFPALLESAFKANILLRKSEVIDLIQKNWEDNQADIKTEMAKLSKELNQVARSISKLQDGPAGHTKAEVQSIAREVFNKMLPNAQLSALSKSNMKSNIKYGLTRVNHFSKGTGAVVNPHHTSPSYVFPSMDLWAINRAIRGFLQNPVPIPNPPSEALTKWDEHGDCWCSPANNPGGLSPSLGVIMGSNIFPEEVVIEHITSTAALEPGATPKEMELLAYIPDIDFYTATKTISDELFPEEAKTDKDLPYRYVRVATWTYDINSAANIQAFPVQLDLKQFASHTNKLIVRSKSNWGSTDYTCLYRVRIHGEIYTIPGLY